jgi:hypothetical protein
MGLVLISFKFPTARMGKMERLPSKGLPTGYRGGSGWFEMSCGAKVSRRAREQKREQKGRGSFFVAETLRARAKITRGSI